MSTLDTILAELPDAVRDIRLNLAAVLAPAAPLSPTQRWCVALAAALTSHGPALAHALAETARPELGAASAAVEADARAAAALMAMNNTYYRFRHVIGKPEYELKPARLRMNRLSQPATGKAELELASLAASALNGCEACVRAHEASILGLGLTEGHVHEAVRIAAVVRAAALALEWKPVPAMSGQSPATGSALGHNP